MTIKHEEVLAYNQIISAIQETEQVQSALSFLELDNDETTKEQIALTAISAPTFQENVRGTSYKQKLLSYGIKEVHIDEVGNVYGRRKGTGDGPTLFVSAHLDTVFPEGTNVEARIEDGIVYAPGIGDDGRGLAVVLTILRAFEKAKIETVGDIIFGATVGEEGLGDLRGVKHFFSEKEQKVDGFISIEPGNPAYATYAGTGSHRYEVTFQAQGGHSFMNFGRASAIHALGRAVGAISEVRVPKEPKTTFNIGKITGGTSVNTIAEEASFLLDIRSNETEALLEAETEILTLIHDAVNREKKHSADESLSVSIKQVGNRPAGKQQEDAPIIQTNVAAVKALGIVPIQTKAGSTDSNVPISLGIPAITLSGGGNCGGAHTLNEWYDPSGAFIGPQSILLTVLGLVGLAGVSTPLLDIRA